MAEWRIFARRDFEKKAFEVLTFFPESFRAFGRPLDLSFLDLRMRIFIRNRLVYSKKIHKHCFILGRRYTGKSTVVTSLCPIEKGWTEWRKSTYDVGCEIVRWQNDVFSTYDVLSSEYFLIDSPEWRNSVNAWFQNEFSFKSMPLKILQTNPKYLG